MIEKEKMFTVSECCEAIEKQTGIAIGHKAVRRYIRDGTLCSIRLGRSYYIRGAWILSFLEKGAGLKKS